MTVVARLARFVVEGAPSSSPFRVSGTKTTLAVIFASIGAFLGAAALVFALAVHPPAPAWIWFAIVSIILLGLGALGPLAFERTRVSAQRPAVAVDRSQGFL